MLALCSCEREPPPVEVTLFALGTEVSVTTFDIDPDRKDELAATVAVLLADRGTDWYPWADGELAAVNNELRLRGRYDDMSPRLAAIIRRAAEIEHDSGGRFNAATKVLTEVWGLHDVTTSPDVVPDDHQIGHALAAASLGFLDWHGGRSISSDVSIEIDLGGIAKGAILEELAGSLTAWGTRDFIVNIGGDLIVSGDRTARIGIQSPDSTAAIAGLNIGDGEVVATSGSYERFVEIGGERFPHVLDPRTGYPVQHTVSVTVIEHDGMLADAAATALMVGGADEFVETVAALGLEYAFLIGATGDLCLTPGMAKRLDWLADDGREAIESSAGPGASSACFINENGG